MTRKIQIQKEIDTLNITCIIHEILNVGSDGNSAVKIEEGEGQRL